MFSHSPSSLTLLRLSTSSDFIAISELTASFDSMMASFDLSLPFLVSVALDFVVAFLLLFCLTTSYTRKVAERLIHSQRINLTSWV